MKVKTRLYISAIISIGLVGMLVFGVVFTSNRIAEEIREYELLHDIQIATSELNLVLYEYLMHRETRMEQQWNLKYDSIIETLRESEEELEKRREREEEEIELLESIGVNFITIGDLFAQVSANYKETQNLIQEETSQKKIDTAMLLEERLVAQLLIISQSIFTDTCKIVHKALDDAAETQELARNLTLISVLIIIVISATTTLFVVRSISKPLDKLIKGTEIIGKGNLKHRIDIKAKDEIGNLAISFNDMSRKLTKSYSLLEKKIEELKELDKLKDDFLNTTTHELKTPLIPIRSQTQLLLSDDYGKLNKEQKEAVEMIFRNENQMERLVNDILDITKLQSKKLRLTLKKTTFAEIVTVAVKNVKNVAKQKNILLVLEPMLEMPEISIDKQRILQVLGNLLSNALKFTPEKGKIVIGVKKKKDDLVVNIKDTGVGMDKKTLKRLFTPFFQAESGLKRKYAGTGLGLSICKRIIEAHNGKIWAESLGQGRGSTFIFTLPIKKPNKH